MASIDSSKGPSASQSLYDGFKYPLLVYAMMASLYIYSSKGYIWFSLHPIAMLVAFVAMAGNATLIKKVGGLVNTRMHGVIMSAATILAAFGFYVIYTNKVMKAKDNTAKSKSGKIFEAKHFTSFHGQVGLAVMVGYTGLAVVGAVALHPDFGVFKAQNLPGKPNPIRVIHKFAGKAMTALAWVSCVLGVQSMGEDFWHQAVFAVPLLLIGLKVLL